MTAQILTAELGNLIQESKRKHADLRNVRYVALDYLSLALTVIGGRESTRGAQSSTLDFRGSDSCWYLSQSTM